MTFASLTQPCRSKRSRSSCRAILRSKRRRYHLESCATLFWRKGQAGTVAGTIDKNGYRIIGIAGQLYWAHRLAWFIHFGKWPTGQIDHVNMDPLDNRLNGVIMR